MRIGVSKGKDGNASLIGRDVIIKGDLTFSGELIIAGFIEGSIIADDMEASRVEILPTGQVRGEIRSAKVAISGQVDGVLHCSDRLELIAGSRLSGSITYAHMQSEPGSLLDGEVHCISGETKRLGHVQEPEEQNDPSRAASKGNTRKDELLKMRKQIAE